MTKISHIARLAFEYKINRLVLSYPPYMLSIEVTNYCNFKCKFCPQSDPEHNKRREQGMLGTNNFCEFVRKVKETLNSNRNISLTLDGEPTLNKSFSDFIRIANEYGLFPRFSSNGFLLTPEYTDQLLKAGRFLAAIDFASEARYFDGVRGFEGSFEKVQNNILYLIDVARRNPQIALEITDISAFGGANESESLSKMIKMLSQNGTLPKNIKTWSRVFHNFCGHMDAKKKGNYVVCPYPCSQFVVAWNRDVAACCRDTSARTILGNLFKTSIFEIWNDKPYQELRRALVEKRPKDIGACAKCDMPYSKESRKWNPAYVLRSLLRR